MTTRHRLAVTLVLGGVLAHVTGAAGASPQERPAWTVPSNADVRANPLAARPDTEPGGAKLFKERCAQCHRDDGSGTSVGPGLSGRRVQSQTDGALFWKITSGNTRTGMPTFSGLPELQRWQLVLHLRALGSSHPAPPKRP
jgi:mono/diheme cytochrome c family protein